MSTARAVVVKDVDPHAFVVEYAKYLKKAGKIELPKYVDTAKLACFNELSPMDPDWYYTRCAAVARRVYIRPGTGIGGLSKAFGAKSRRGTVTGRRQMAGTAVIRHCLQSLEKMGITEHTPNGGRRLTKEGQRDLDRIAQQVAFPDLAE